MNTSKFELPNPNGKEGGACTSALLQVFYDNAHKLNNLTWVQVLQQMRCELKSMGYPQEPQLSSSRRIDVHKPVCLVPKGSGRRRALLIGINYGTAETLSGDVCCIEHWVHFILPSNRVSNILSTDTVPLTFVLADNSWTKRRAQGPAQRHPQPGRLLGKCGRLRPVADAGAHGRRRAPRTDPKEH
jgi:hypothetical protein